MAAALIGASSITADEFSYEAFRYRTLDSLTVTCIGMSTNYSRGKDIPAYARDANNKSYKVTQVAPKAFINNIQLTRGIYSGTSKYIEEIGDSAFFGCSNMTVFLPPTACKRIGVRAAAGTAITGFSLGAPGLEYMGEGMLENCKKMKSVWYDSKCTAFPKNFAKGCIMLNKVEVFPADFTSIGDSAFVDCPISIFSLGATVPPTVSSTAFVTGPANKTINYPTAILYVPDAQFSTYASASFWSNFGIKRVNTDFNYDGYTYFWNVGTGALNFKGIVNKNQVEAVIPSTVNLVGQTWTATYFYGESCLNNKVLTAVALEDGFETLGAKAFSGCSNLIYAQLPNSLTKVCSNAFYNCESLKTLKLGDNVTFENNALKNCTGLDTIYCNSTNPNTTINNAGLDSTVYARCIVVVPAGSRNAYLSKAGWNNFAEDHIIGLDQVTGIEEKHITLPEATPVYYDLTGCEVANPRNGVFIMRRGNEVKKIRL